MDEIIRIKDEYYIKASSSLADEQPRVLKQGNTFAVFDRHGDVRSRAFADHGLYHHGTRYLSRFVLRINDDIPLLLSSNVKEDNDFLTVDLTNPDIETRGQVIGKGVVHLVRTTFLWNACCFQRIHVLNYGLKPVAFELHIELAADFADIFEVRGMTRKERGTAQPAQVGEGGLRLAYRGLDGIERAITLETNPKPAAINEEGARFPVELVPRAELMLDCILRCHLDGEETYAEGYDTAWSEVKELYGSYRRTAAKAGTSNEQFNDWIRQSRADLEMLLTRTESGLYPYAGIPWYSTIFGRDGIITALQSLWLYPEIARGVLTYLAACQATEKVGRQDAEPGKILHELRRSEMALTGEVPFARYYGTVDATPLFIALAGRYFERTGEKGFIESLWPAIERALQWIDTYGDRDGDGFVEYGRRASGGLVNQGWKDSEDSISHADGGLAIAPIALCEVQGYVYDAKLSAAGIAAALGKSGEADRLGREARELRERFIRDFWCDEIQMYALALDGKKRQCKVRSSNAGHCLFSGIADEHHAALIAAQLTGEAGFTGWGIRTLLEGEQRYNPMSYHNGSVWPHDNAVIAQGFARYGLRDAMLTVLKGLFDASIFIEMHRMPELFCGFRRRQGEGPTLYPVACDPQAWAAASVFMLLQACLGLTISMPDGRLLFDHPVLPDFLDEVEIINLPLGPAQADLIVKRHGSDVAIHVLRKTGDFSILTRK